MNLWMILIIAGKIGAVAGPLPYNIFDCLSRTEARQEQFIESYMSGIREPGVNLHNTYFMCVHSRFRPELTMENDDE